MFGSPLTSFCLSELWREKAGKVTSSDNGQQLGASSLQGTPMICRDRDVAQTTSPGADSNLMFSLPHSPSQYQQRPFGSDIMDDLMVSTFSPSIFSPPERKTRVLRQNCEEESPVLFRLDEDSRESQAEGEENSQDHMDVNHSSSDTSPAPSKGRPLTMKFSRAKRRASQIEATLRPETSSSWNSRRDGSEHMVVTPEVGGRRLARKRSVDADSDSSYNSRKRSQRRGLFPSEHSRGNIVSDCESSPSGAWTHADEDDTDAAQDSDEMWDEQRLRTSGYKAHASSPRVISSCNCKKSKCLKLYCDCFAVLQFCDSETCKCQQCNNTEAHEATRNNAIRTIKERNPRAFRVKINEDEKQHVTGCHCKNSHCLKKYCECFTANALCGTNCKCLSCDNFSGSEELLKVRKAQGVSVEALAMAQVQVSPSPSADGGGVSGLAHSRKRKESPSSVTLLDASPPQHGMSSAAKKSPGSFAMLSSSQYTPPASQEDSGVLGSRRSKTHLQPQSQPQLQQQHQQQGTPLTWAKRVTRACSARERDREVSESASDRRGDYDVMTTPDTASGASAANMGKFRLKSKRVRFASNAPVVYPFFGPQHPSTTKLVALKVLDFLSCKDLYTMSTVNSLWCSASTDEALWE